jgi:hypothetical protein
MAYILIIALIIVTIIFKFRWFMATGLIIILLIYYYGVI